MITVASIIILSIVAMLLHAVFLRFLPVHWTFRSIPLFYLASAGLVFLVNWAASGGVSFDEAVQIIVVSFSIIVCYAFTVVGIVHDSPTLALVKAVKRHEAVGMSEADFQTFVDQHPFVESRISALIGAGELDERQEGMLRVSGKAMRLLALCDIYRRLRGNSLSRTG